MSTIRDLMLSCSLWILGSGQLLLAQAGGKEPSIQDIFAAWEKREAAVHSLVCEWTEKTTYGRGGFSFSPTFLPEKGTMTFEYLCVFKMDGNKLWYSRKGPAWIEEAKEIQEEERIDSFDGKRVKRLAHLPKADSTYPRYSDAWVEPAKSFDLSDLFELNPLFLAYRPSVYESRGLSAGNCSFVEKRAFLDGRPCSVFSRNNVRSDKYWIGWEREAFPIMSVSRHTDGTILQQQTITVSPGAGHVPKISGWNSIWNRESGELKHSSECLVTRFELNPKLTENDFEFKFPFDSYVRDNMGNKDLVYILQEDGKRIVTQEEILRGATYQELLATETGQARAAGGSFGLWPWLVLVVLVSLAGWATLTIVRRKRSAQ